MSAFSLFVKTFITSVNDILSIQMTLFDKYTFSLKDAFIISAFIGFFVFVVRKIFIS